VKASPRPLSETSSGRFQYFASPTAKALEASSPSLSDLFLFAFSEAVSR
jgi:hypothetical protein